MQNVYLKFKKVDYSMIYITWWIYFFNYLKNNLYQGILAL